MNLKLQKATLIQRYKRFLADVILQDKQKTTMHVANTGAMSGCADKDDIVWYSTSDNKNRKYPFSWELTEKPNGDLICVNTIRANQLVEEALTTNVINELTNFESLAREVKYGSENSKIDFLLTDASHQKVYIEVKSVTLINEQQGYFPDAVTTRGQKHLRELIEVVESGDRAVLFFAVLHSAINSVKAARHIDKKYAELLTLAHKSGVEILAYKADFSYSNGETQIIINRQVPVVFEQLV